MTGRRKGHPFRPPGDDRPRCRGARVGRATVDDHGQRQRRKLTALAGRLATAGPAAPLGRVLILAFGALGAGLPLVLIVRRLRAVH